MPQLWGTLEPTELPALVRFLCDVGATGCLRLAGARRAGALWLDGGRLVAARSGASRGRAALDAVALPEGEFVFAGDGDPPEPDPGPGGSQGRGSPAAPPGGGRALGPPRPPARGALGPGAPGGGRARRGPDPRSGVAARLARRRPGGAQPGGDRRGGDLLATAEALQSLRDLGLVQAEGHLEGRLQGEQRPAPAGAGAAPPAPDAPERAPAGGPRFRPTAAWQEVPPGTAVPPGGEYRMELGGKVLARWPRPPPEAAPAP